jgi:hypothetical protein
MPDTPHISAIARLLILGNSRNAISTQRRDRVRLLAKAARRVLW